MPALGRTAFKLVIACMTLIAHTLTSGSKLPRQAGVIGVCKQLAAIAAS